MLDYVPHGDNETVTEIARRANFFTIKNLLN
jgi:hypothetical protein